MLRVMSVFGAALILASCAANKPALSEVSDASGVKVIEGTVMPEPNKADLFEKSRPYLIGPFDKLSIDVFGIQELSNREVQTDAGGRFSFPLAGVIDASGKTPSELETEIEGRLRRSFVRNPQVTVNLKEAVSQVITVDGQVREPGLYPVIGRMTLIRAVATAKGTSEFAKLDDVVIFRTVGNEKLAALYNLKAIRNGAYPDPEVFANDVVVVGDSKGRRLFKDFLQLAPALVTPIIILLQGKN